MILIQIKTSKDTANKCTLNSVYKLVIDEPRRGRHIGLGTRHEVFTYFKMSYLCPFLHHYYYCIIYLICRFYQLPLIRRLNWCKQFELSISIFPYIRQTMWFWLCLFYPFKPNERHSSNPSDFYQVLFLPYTVWVCSCILFLVYRTGHGPCRRAE